MDNRTGDRLLHWFRRRIRRKIRHEIHEAFMTHTAFRAREGVTSRVIEAAQDRCHAVNAPHLATQVRAGATFINGKLVERPGENTQPEAV